MKRFFTGLIALIIIGCKAQKIDIYFLVSLTGPESTYGKQAKEGIELLYKKVMGKKIKGREINVLIKDIKSSVNEVKDIVEKITEDENAICIIGPEISKLAIVAGAVADKKGIPLITPTATHPMVTEGKTFVFRLTYTDPLQGSYMAKFAIFNLKKKKAGILFEANNPYSEELARQFEAVFKKEGGEVVFSTFYLKEDTLFDAQIESFKKYNPDIIFIPGYIKEVVSFLKEADKKGLKAVFLGGDGWHSPELISSLKDLWDKGVEAYLTTPFSPQDTSKKVREFVNEFKEKYGSVPQVASALYYDAFALTLSVLEKMNKINRNEFRKTLLNLREFKGVTGKVAYEGKRDPKRDVFILKPESKGFKFVTKLHFE